MEDFTLSALYTIGVVLAIVLYKPLIFVPFFASLINLLSIMDRIDRYNRQKGLEVSEKLRASENPLIVEALEKASRYVINDNFELAIKELRSVLAMPRCEANPEVEEKLTEYQNKFDRQQVWKSGDLISKNKFTMAISTLERIVPNSEVYYEAQQKLNDYRKAFYIYLVQDASNKAAAGRFSEALESLRHIPEGAEVYQQAQKKISEYAEIVKQEELKRERARKEAQRTIELEKQQQASEREAAEQKRQQQASEQKAAEQKGQEQLASSLLQHAFMKASNGCFHEALALIRNIPPGTRAYQQVPAKIIEYEEAIKQQAAKQQAAHTQSTSEDPYKRYYDVLDLKPGASRAEIKQAYRDLSQIWHPDCAPKTNPRLEQMAEKKMRLINEAYEILSNL